MANTYFKFKQFTIHQEQCAMKVTTDGCLFGAMAAKALREMGGVSVLDIGTGTGLLSLMAAQQNPSAVIDAIEIDTAAAVQAQYNVDLSPWKERIRIVQGNILGYQPGKYYDVVISNPPFYEHQLGSPDPGRQLAHHSSSLDLLSLLQQVDALLSPLGKCYLLLPYYRTGEGIARAATMAWFPVKQWQIRHTPRHDWFRTILCLGRQPQSAVSLQALTIRQEDGNYTPAFAELLHPYYLKL